MALQQKTLWGTPQTHSQKKTVKFQKHKHDQTQRRAPQIRTLTTREKRKHPVLVQNVWTPRKAEKTHSTDYRDEKSKQSMEKIQHSNRKEKLPKDKTTPNWGHSKRSPSNTRRHPRWFTLFLLSNPNPPISTTLLRSRNWRRIFCAAETPNGSCHKRIYCTSHKRVPV